MQNFAPGVGAVPHLGQVAGRNDAPHSLQNFAPVVFSVAQLGQIKR